MRVLGVTVDNVSFNETIAQIEQFIESGKSHHIVTVNPEYIVRAQNDQKLRNLINRADLHVPDGIGLVKLAGLKERVTGTDLVWTLAKLSHQKSHKLALLGAYGDTAHKAAQKLQQKYLQCRVVLAEPTEEVTEKLIKQLQELKPEVVFVALGMGKQDFFIEQLLKKVKIPVAMGVGGAFDMIAGVTPRAPYILRTLGLEWLWRLIIQPSRLKRIFTATVIFPILYAIKKRLWDKAPENELYFFID